MVGGVNVNCLWTDTITLYQTDVLSTHLVKLLIYVGTNVWGGHGAGEGAYFGYGKPAHPRGWAGCWQPRVPAVHPLMAEKHSEQIAPLERGGKKKSSRNWGKLAVEQKLGEAEGLRSPAAFTGSLGWAGCSRFFFYLFLLLFPSFCFYFSSCTYVFREWVLFLWSSNVLR